MSINVSNKPFSSPPARLFCQPLISISQEKTNAIRKKFNIRNNKENCEETWKKVNTHGQRQIARTIFLHNKYVKYTFKHMKILNYNEDLSLTIDLTSLTGEEIDMSIFSSFDVTVFTQDRNIKAQYHKSDI